MKYHNITKDDMLNGEGLRVVLWVSGCAHACKGCHNAIAWDSGSGLDFNEESYTEIASQLKKDYINGITLSGGDPLYPENRNDIENLIYRIKQNFPQKSIWLYTGYLWEEIKELSFIKHIDVIVDGRFEQALSKQKLEWKGSSNQRVIDVKRSIIKNDVILLK